MKEILNSISVLTTFVTTVGIIYILLNESVGKIRGFRSISIGKNLLLKDILFLIVALLLIQRYVTFYKPW
jgi:uncharacterized membrane protein YkgB